MAAGKEYKKGRGVQRKHIEKMVSVFTDGGFHYGCQDQVQLDAT